MPTPSPSARPIRNRRGNSATPTNDHSFSLTKGECDIKSRAILKAAATSPPDIDFLRSQCITAGGLGTAFFLYTIPIQKNALWFIILHVLFALVFLYLVSSSIRFRVWPILANIDVAELDPVSETNVDHASSDQVQVRG